MKRLILCALAWLLLATAGYAQGIQTGTIRGMVRDSDNLPAPRVTVTVTSPALQGVRSATSDAQGYYAVPALPAGEYQAKFELAGTAKDSKLVALHIATMERYLTRVQVRFG